MIPDEKSPALGFRSNGSGLSRFSSSWAESGWTALGGGWAYQVAFKTGVNIDVVAFLSENEDAVSNNHFGAAAAPK